MATAWSAAQAVVSQSVHRVVGASYRPGRVVGKVDVMNRPDGLADACSGNVRVETENPADPEFPHSLADERGGDGTVTFDISQGAFIGQRATSESRRGPRSGSRRVPSRTEDPGVTNTCLAASSPVMTAAYVPDTDGVGGQRDRCPYDNGSAAGPTQDVPSSGGP